MRVLVCGGRKYANEELVIREIHKLRPKVIIHGGATGADALAHAYASLWSRIGVLERIFTADWDTHGRAAGPIRNQEMLDKGKPDIVLAFPGGRGTADMVRRAKAAGIEVREIQEPASA